MSLSIITSIILIALTSCAVPADGPVQRKLDDGVFLRETWPIPVMPALPVMPEFEPVGERWYLRLDPHNAIPPQGR